LHCCAHTRKAIMPLRTLFTVPDSYSVRQLPSVRRFSSCLKWQAPSGTCMRSPELNSTCMRVPGTALHSNMFRLQMWLQFPAGVHHDHAALCPSSLADRHRDASRRHHPTPATPFVCEPVRQPKCLALGPARVLVTNRHRG
jgi:hypothetical protein